jgi:nucleoid-associated protein YgaU
MGDEELQKATLRVVDGTAETDELVFAFNPTEYTVAKSAAWSRPPMRGGARTGKPEFQGANPQTLQMEIFFDDWWGVDVGRSIQTLLEWVKPTRDSLAKKKPRPPILIFDWGPNPVLWEFPCYLKEVRAKYDLFSPGGRPLRASASITLEEVPFEEGRQNPTSGSIHGRRTILVSEGETLASIAWREYEDPTLWRGLATFNGIDDPLRLRPGSTLLLPTADEARRLS